MLVGLFFELGTDLSFGLISDTELKIKDTPNQGIHQLARNCLVVGLVSWLVGGLGGGVTLGLGVGLDVGLGGWVFSGGVVVLRHYRLRWLLYHNGFLLFRNLVPFLDYCAERIFLRKVGSGYIVVHRLLLEHFASLYTESNQPAAPPK